MRLPKSVVRELMGGAEPNVQWNAATVEKVGHMAEEFIFETAARAANRALKDDRKTVKPDDVKDTDPAVPMTDTRVIRKLKLLDLHVAHLRSALKDAGVKKIPPYPLVTKEDDE